MLRAYKVFLVTAYPQSELVRTMKRLLACLALCASLSASAQDDCELFNIQEIAAELQNTTLDTALVQTNGSIQVQLSNGNAFQLVLGCTDSDYIEYQAFANTDDGSCATLIVNGCTDPAYIEYSTSANTDDGSCTTAVVQGCTNPSYTEYSAYANTDDGSCVTFVVEGCTDSTYEEYDINANTDDGSCITLSSCAPVSFDGYTYSVVEIGDQCWFAENLQTTSYADGSEIPEVVGSGTWTGLNSGARCDYGNDTTIVLISGRLYNWFAVNDASGLCPNGWHVPTNDEWTELEMHVSTNGHSGNPASALKAASGWPNAGNGTDDFGFSAFPGGNRYYGSGEFGNPQYGYWWSSTYDAGYAWFRLVFDDLPDIYKNSWDLRYGFSVRCLKDAD